MAKNNNNNHIKNDSLFIPFQMPGDSFFDSNHDGKLTGLETMQRDAYHMNMAQQFEKANENNEPNLKSEPHNYINTNNDSNNNTSKSPNNNTIILSSFSTVAVVIIAFVLCTKTDNDFLKALVLFASVGIGVLILTLSGVMAPSKKPAKNEREKKGINKNYWKKWLIVIAIIVAILTAVGVKQYNYAKSYFDAIDTIMAGDYSTAKDFLLVNYVGDDFLDSKSLQLFCLAMSDYEAENYFGAYYIIHNYYGGCRYLTSKQREFVNSNIKNINDAYENEHETTTQVETTRYYTTTQATTEKTTTKEYSTTTTTTKKNKTTKKSSVGVHGNGSIHTNNSSGTTKKQTTTRKTTTKKQTTTKKDPYNVNDYSDEEDFYYDHYDDFFDYYDAEDYYREHHK